MIPIYLPNCNEDGTYTLEFFTDASFAPKGNKRRSVSGQLIKLNGCVLYHKSKRQGATAQSSSQAEYVSINESARVIGYIQRTMEQMEITAKKPSVILTDSNVSIDWATSSSYTTTRHLEIKHYGIMDGLQQGKMVLQYVPGSGNFADKMTKLLGEKKWKDLREYIGFRSMEEIKESTE